MKKLTLLFTILSSLALCQATWTPPVQPTSGTPGKLGTVAGTCSTAIN